MFSRQVVTPYNSCSADDGGELLDCHRRPVSHGSNRDENTRRWPGTQPLPRPSVVCVMESSVRIINCIQSTPKTMSDKIPYSVENGDPYKHVGNIIHQEEAKGLDDSNLPDYQDKEVKRILRKVDWRLPPVLAVLYLMSFLDRSNSTSLPVVVISCVVYGHPAY